MDANGDCICDATQNFVYSPASSVCICEPGMFLNMSGVC